MWSNETLVFAVAAFAQLLGVSSVVLARLSEKSAAQAVCQLAFLLCLALVGGIGVVATSIGLGCGLVCATTLPLMAVGATLDLGRTADCSAF